MAITKKRKKYLRKLMNTKEKRLGRPPKISEDIIQEFKKVLPTCLFIESIGASLGLDRTTWKNWLKRGRREYTRLKVEAAKPIRKERLYLRFYLTYRKAIAKGEISLTKELKKHGKKHWQAIAFMLERRFQDRWGTDKAEFRRLHKQVQELAEQLKGEDE